MPPVEVYMYVISKSEFYTFLTWEDKGGISNIMFVSNI